MPTLTKVSFGIKDTYHTCIEVNGVLRATVSKIDNVQSTKMVLNRKIPAAYAALHNKWVKQDLLHAAKLEKYPNGLDVDAIEPMFRADLTKPLPKHYIHSYLNIGDGSIIIVTFVPYLLKLLDNPRVTSFDGDTTFKGIEGKLNKWELTIFAKVVQCGAFFPCWPVNDLESLVSTTDFNRLKDFIYIDSKEPLDAFSAFVYGLGVKKITDWWRHKEMHVWIIPCLIKSQSLISADVSDSTPSMTNTNKVQHHWNNSLTGIKLTPVQAVESRCMVDLNFAGEVKMSIQTGILSNPNNEICMQSARVVRDEDPESTAQGKFKWTRQNSVSESINMQAPAPPLATQSENISTTVHTVPTTATQSAALSVPEFDSAQPTTGSAFNFLPDFNFDFNMFTDSLSLEGANTGGSFPAQAPSTDPSTFNLTFDPALFSLSADFNAAIPSGALPEDPLQDFLNLYGISGISTDLGATANFGTFTLAGPFIDPLPLLPLPLPESPPAPSPTVEHSSEPGPSAPRSHHS
ncbi:hypothetical protein B0H10DRAFT_1966876 [Mycena sp. CBHHK59/15]|nr:hypothetical protein B0H10DRAFT_1966876 [Mycena sp. CBHHK59/15]